MKSVCTAAAFAAALVMASAGYAQANTSTDFFQLAGNGTPQQVQAALNNGADVNAPDKDGKTPLMAAAFNPNSEVIVTLLKAGANINAQDNDGGTPLIWAAAFNQNPDVILMLLRAGADPKAKTKEGQTALDLAQSNAKLKASDAYRQLQAASQ